MFTPSKFCFKHVQRSEGRPGGDPIGNSCCISEIAIIGRYTGSPMGHAGSYVAAPLAPCPEARPPRPRPCAHVHHTTAHTAIEEGVSEPPHQTTPNRILTNRPCRDRRPPISNNKRNRLIRVAPCIIIGRDRQHTGNNER